MILLKCNSEAQSVSIFIEFYVLVDVVIDIISKMKTVVEKAVTESSRTWKSKSQKRKLKELNAPDELPLGEAYRISHFLPIIDSLISALSKRFAAYSGLMFGFFAKLGLGEISDDLRSAAKIRN